MEELGRIVYGDINARILIIREIHVIVDSDLAYFYNVSTKVLNQAVKRNMKRFPKEFMFRLTAQEKDELVTNCDRLKKLKHSSVLPNVFTEQGIAMLSSVLKSNTAIEISVAIIKAFTEMKKTLYYYSGQPRCTQTRSILPPMAGLSFDTFTSADRISSNSVVRALMIL